MPTEDSERFFLEKTVQTAAAYFSKNTLPAENIEQVLETIYFSLRSLPDKQAAVVQDRSKPIPAVNPKKSIFNDYLICLEDGHKVKLLRRYLQNKYQMTPEQYRERWGLAKDYPMVAPSYTERRSAVARSIGLGTETAPQQRRGRPAKKK